MFGRSVCPPSPDPPALALFTLTLLPLLPQRQLSEESSFPAAGRGRWHLHLLMLLSSIAASAGCDRAENNTALLACLPMQVGMRGCRSVLVCAHVFLAAI